MLKQIQEFGKYVEITGFRNVKISNTEEFLKAIRRGKLENVDVQFFDARLVATWQHLYFAALNALTAFRNKENISRTLPMEALLYASAQRQIRKATELIGINPNSTEVALLVIGGNPEAAKAGVSAVSTLVDGERDDAVLELSKEKEIAIRKAFEVSQVELQTVTGRKNLENALTDLVIERMALLVTHR